ncbi:hypothetical protein [Entomospira culicis]|uniref:Uncharacterized protein n=1 Tax=Entomospira culicis TaxID=2719989 RepID=A0A968KU95_9SPIO|nr:hypothetical protein [Entomospira culicis]NIZ19090.1 hypothetical protein [Entomospira culicis]NIZ69304.1 hypothetical protein [Entomospira culicis]WDI37890.1 hypothetical protein PVA46_03635 [Entomospira culicis]WDI39517.1 hypothetical protein PVA47_03635 [Entomospira culicis]
MWQYKSQIGLPLDPLFLSLGHATLPYPHQLLKDEALGGFSAPFNLTPFHPYTIFQSFNLWHSSKGVNRQGEVHQQAILLFKDNLSQANGYNTILHHQPILVGDFIYSKQSYFTVLASTGQFNAKRKQWQITAVLSKPSPSPSIASLPEPRQLTALDYSYYQALLLALNKSFDADSTLADAILSLADSTKSYLDNIVQYLSSATAGAGTAGTTLIPPITSMSTLWDTAWQSDVKQIQSDNQASIDDYQEAIDEVEEQEPHGFDQGGVYDS